MKDSDPENLVKHLVEYLNQKDIAFIELMETFSLEGKDAANKKAFFEGKSYTSFRQAFKRSFKNTWIANHGLTQETANQTLEKGEADLVSFGQLYVANDDLVHKFRNNQTPNKIQNADLKQLTTYLYGEGPLGYTDLSVYEPKKK